MKNQNPKITFGIIVLNGEPFVEYNLRSLYPFAHEIIVVEGAVPGAASIADSNGHSNDGTLKILKNLKKQHDPDNKLHIITAEDEGYSNGFWPGEKDEQSKAFAKRATGNYLWQVDIDEFYKSEDIKTVINILVNDPTITAVSFKMITFWGELDYTCDGWYLRRGANQFHRLFKWKTGYDYSTHRPPTVLNENGVDLREINWLNAKELERKGIYLYHYSLLFPKQVHEKCIYYQEAEWAKRENAKEWAEENYDKLSNPFRVHNVYNFPSWLKRFKGSHPAAVQQLWQDIHLGKKTIELRRTDDIERVLSSTVYRIKIPFYILFGKMSWFLLIFKKMLKKIYLKIKEIKDELITSIFTCI